MKQYFVGIIGFGGEGFWHFRKLGDCANISLKGVYDVSEKRRAFAREKGIYVYGTAEAMFCDKEIDIVIIATPNDSHKSLAIRAMRAGKHVICEKPATLNAEDLSEVLAVSKECGRIFSVYQNRRWDGDFLAVKKIIDENRIGDIYRIESRVHGSRGIPDDWRKSAAQGGGMLLDWGMHLFDQALLLKAGVKIAYVSATMSFVQGHEVDDGFTANLTFEDGDEVTVEVGTCNLIPLPRWYLVAEKGTAVVRTWNVGAEIVAMPENEAEIEVIPVRTAAGISKTMAPRPPETVHKKAMPIVESNVCEFYENFVRCAEGFDKLLVSVEDIIRVTRLIDTVKKAAETHRTIPFEEP